MWIIYSLIQKIHERFIIFLYKDKLVEACKDLRTEAEKIKTHEDVVSVQEQMNQLILYFKGGRIISSRSLEQMYPNEEVLVQVARLNIIVFLSIIIQELDPSDRGYGADTDI